MKGETQTQKLSADQRKALADMLGTKSDARRRARIRYEKSEKELEGSLIKVMAEKEGATKLVTKIAELRKRIAESESELNHLVVTLRETHGTAVTDFEKEIDGAEEELRRLGFGADRDGDLSLHWGAETLRRSIHEQIEKEIGSESDIDHKFDQAQARVLTAETAEEAAQIVESLL